MAERVRLGELLVEAGVITRDALDQVLVVQKHDGRRLGTLLVERGVVTETQVTQILSQQLSIPWVSLYHIDFSRPLLNLVPRDVAERYCLVPIFVRRVRGVGETLYVAMDDPTDEQARAAVSEYSGLPVRSMIAPPSDIRSAIRAYYTLPSLTPPGNTSAEAPELEVHSLDAGDVAEALAAEAAEREGGEPATERADPPSFADSAGPDEPPPAPGAPEGRSRSRRSDTLVSVGVEPPPTTVDAVAPTQAVPAGPLPVVVSRAAAPVVVVPATPAPVDAAPVVAVEAAAASSGLGSVVITEPGRPAPVLHDEPAPDSGVPIPSRQVPPPKKGKQGRMITLTLLDGTQVTLPARRRAAPDAEPTDVHKAAPSAPAAAPGHALTARDLVEALCAVSHGTDASDVLGEDVKWEAIVGALLATLLKKHLVADWEFVEELERFRKG